MDRPAGRNQINRRLIYVALPVLLLVGLVSVVVTFHGKARTVVVTIDATQSTSASPKPKLSPGHSDALSSIVALAIADNKQLVESQLLTATQRKALIQRLVVADQQSNLGSLYDQAAQNFDDAAHLDPQTAAANGYYTYQPLAQKVTSQSSTQVVVAIEAETNAGTNDHTFSARLWGITAITMRKENGAWKYFGAQALGPVAQDPSLLAAQVIGFTPIT